MRTSRLLVSPVALALALSGLVIAVAPGVLSAQTVVRHLETELELANAELEGVLTRYRRAGSAVSQALGRAEAAWRELDTALTAANPDPDDLATRRRRAEEDRAAADAAERERDGLLDEALTLLRRRRLLEGELRRLRGAPADLPDPLTGAWRITLRPGNQQGLLDLTLDGTVVQGTLGLGDGSFGSVRGSFAAGSLRLERLSADQGLDLLFDGRFDPRTQTLSGTWRPLELGQGESGGGTWQAVRSRPGTGGGGGSP